jgi:hypothetical protein
MVEKRDGGILTVSKPRTIMTPKAMTHEENDRLPQDRASTICSDGEGRAI